MKSGENLKRVRSFFVNGCILTATGLLMRSIGMSFQVYLGARLGAVGMGLFTLILSVYGFCVTLANSGIHLATVRMVSVAVARGSGAQTDGALRRCLCYSLCFGVGTALLLYTCAPVIGVYLLEDLRTVRSLRILALGLPFVSSGACMNGYFHAVQRVKKNAALQIAEQGAYMLITTMLLQTLLPKGIEYACMAVVGGSCLSDILSCALLAIELSLDRKKYRLPRGEAPVRQTRHLLGIALPVAVSSYARSALLTVEHILIPRGLRRHGSDAQGALAAYGILHGMALPTVLFGQSFLFSFASLLIPELSCAQARGDRARICRIVEKALCATMPFAVGMAVFLLCFCEPLGALLYHEAQAAQYIRRLAPLVIVMYLDTVTDSMLKGLGEQLYSMRVNIADAAISVVGVWLLLPHYGLGAYFVILYFCEIFNTACSISRLLQRTGLHTELMRASVSLLAAALGAAAICNLVQATVLPSRSPLFCLLLGGGLFLLCYFGLLWGLRFWNRERRQAIRSLLFAP